MNETYKFWHWGHSRDLEKSQKDIVGESVCGCQECGREGDNSCGHESLDDDCALDDYGVCPCCNVDINHMKKITVEDKRPL